MNKTLQNKHRVLATCLFACMVWFAAWAQMPYGYAPANPLADDLSALGGNKNQFVQGLTCFNPAEDPVLQRLQGKEVIGVRCYVHADYAQARQKRSGILACEGTPDNIIRQTYVDLTEGWNDIMFEEPYTIGEQLFYLGLQVYELVGKPYPLVAYAKATVPHSCLVNQGKKTWEEYTDRGTLLIFALLADDAAENFDRAAYAQNTTHPQTVAPDQDFTGGLYIHNFTPNPISTVEIAMQGEGAIEPTKKSITLPTPLEGYGSTVVTAQLRAGTTESTTASFSCWVSRINNDAAQTARPGVTTLFVTKDNFLRVPIVEEFTSQRCINCPQMAYFLDKAFEQYDGPYVYLSHHSGFRDDTFTTDADREITYLFGGYENEYNPAIMYNRATLEGEDVVVQGIRDMSPTPYLNALTEAAQMPAMAEVIITDEGGKVTISGRVASDLIDSPLRLSCFLVEDGITTSNYPQMGMDEDDAPADLKDVFRHNGVILHSFASDALGDALSVNADGTYSVSFPHVEKEGYGGTTRRIVALVHKVNKADLRDNQVLNAAQLLQTSDIRPATTHQNRPSAIYDLSGRKVKSRLQKGIYIVDGKKHVLL